MLEGNSSPALLMLQGNFPTCPSNITRECPSYLPMVQGECPSHLPMVQGECPTFLAPPPFPQATTAGVVTRGVSSVNSTLFWKAGSPQRSQRVCTVCRLPSISYQDRHMGSVSSRRGLLNSYPYCHMLTFFLLCGRRCSTPTCRCTSIAVDFSYQDCHMFF